MPGRRRLVNGCLCGRHFQIDTDEEAHVEHEPDPHRDDVDDDHCPLTALDLFGRDSPEDGAAATVDEHGPQTTDDPEPEEPLERDTEMTAWIRAGMPGSSSSAGPTVPPPQPPPITPQPAPQGAPMVRLGIPKRVIDGIPGSLHESHHHYHSQHLQQRIVHSCVCAAL
jgi:hypothetical protein